jgi:hypothetical protein
MSIQLNLSPPRVDKAVMQVATFVIAVLGWVTAAISLTWNVVSWLLSAARITAELAVGAVIMPGAQYMMLPAKPGWRDQVEKNLTRNGLTGEEAVMVTARNTGRNPITIESCSFRSDTGLAVGTIGRPDWGDAFPIRLEPGASTVVGYRADLILNAARYLHDKSPSTPVVIRAQLSLATGKTISAAPAMPV